MNQCIICEKEKDMSKLHPIFEIGTSMGDEEDFYENPKYICIKCLKKTDEYGECDMCDGTGVYHAEDLDEWGHCKEHAEECRFDEDEEDGWNDIIDNWNK